MDPVPDPLLLRKSGSAGDRTRDLCICSQKLCVIIVILIIINVMQTSYLFRWVLEALSSGVKLPEREADHPLLSRMQRTILLLHHNIFIARYVIKNTWDCT